MSRMALLLPVLSAGTSAWRRHAGVNCFAGRGATELDSPTGSLTLADCQTACLDTPGCTALVQQAVSLEWTQHASVNCYAGHGATELPDGSGTSNDCPQMTLEECKNQCFLTSGCTGVTWDNEPAGGYCCLRSNIDIGSCDKNAGDWDTHILSNPTVLTSGGCYLRTDIVVAHCDTTTEIWDTHVLGSNPADPWWLKTHFAERTFMPRHYTCSIRNATCTLKDLQGMLPHLQETGYSVVNVDWPIESGPDALYEGFGAKDYMNVDPLLGSWNDWSSFVDEAHRRGMKVIADFNPSYFWTGAPKFKEALADVLKHGLESLPSNSPAHWFRWKDSCEGCAEQPADDKADMGYVDGWVYSSVAKACYWSVWGNGQPCGDLAKPEWRKELTNILTFWVRQGLDGFMLDAPPDYLASENGTHDGLHDAEVASYIRSTIVEPMHALGVPVFGEMYNFQRPTVAKMLDGGRNTDMPDGFQGFPGKLHDMVVSGDASGLEALLEGTVDRFVGWYGGTPRTEPHSQGDVAIAGQKAAATALLAGYYVVRFGPDCVSPHWSYPTSPPGDEWPGGCYGDWVGATAVAATLKALPSNPALRPGTPRRALTLSCGSPGGYAALRLSSSGEAAVVVFNFASDKSTICIELAGSGVAASQTPTDIIAGGTGPAIPASGAWNVQLPAHGWAAYAIAMEVSV